jgi:hypothetical protein
VLCPAGGGPWSSEVIKLKLFRKLPGTERGRTRRSTHGLPWAVVTAEGWKCRLDTGATRVAQGRRENYSCKGTRRWLYGAPDRGSEPWKIYVAGSQATRLHNKTAIKSAWF